ncbi:hypothetical protein [uncultured Photobacterium sp.]|uniref:hypothetical protein n=1 Tax=uncultured Photobacterium sp. TaxID=173973 RepID=UPI00260278D0|nr:hypothetical protein [uncultured Photobacterium sp.]
MQKISKLKKYVELFNRHISRYLAQNISIKTVIYPVSTSGAVFEFIFNDDDDTTISRSDTRPTVGDVLISIPQSMVKGDIHNFTFSGTSLYLENNRIVVIKGENSSKEWDGNAVIKDIDRIVNSFNGEGR